MGDESTDKTFPKINVGIDYGKLASAVAGKVVDPVADKVIDPVANKVVNPVSNKVIDPVGQEIIEPIAKTLSDELHKVFQKPSIPVLDELISPETLSNLAKNVTSLCSFDNFTKISDLYNQMEPFDSGVFLKLIDSLNQLLSDMNSLTQTFPSTQQFEVVINFIEKKISRQKVLIEKYGADLLKNIRIPHEINDLGDLIESLNKQILALNKELSCVKSGSNANASPAKVICSILMILQLILGFIADVLSGLGNMFPFSLSGQIGAGVAAGPQAEASGMLTVIKCGTVIFGSWSLLFKLLQDIVGCFVSEIQLLG